jgi:hypothetical protein
MEGIHREVAPEDGSMSDAKKIAQLSRSTTTFEDTYPKGYLLIQELRKNTSSSLLKQRGYVFGMFIVWKRIHFVKRPNFPCQLLLIVVCLPRPEQQRDAGLNGEFGLATSAAE